MLTTGIPKIKASIEGADLGYLAKQIESLDDAGVDGLHFDVKDGQFIPEISMGAMFVRGLRKYTSIQFDVHLWVKSPDLYIDSLVEAGADVLVVHYEIGDQIGKTLEQIRATGCKVGLAINPDTQVRQIEPLISLCDEINVMTITPGVRGQLNEQGVNNLREASILAATQSPKPIIQVDGAVSLKTRDLFLQAGAESLIAGYPIFSTEDFNAAVRDLRYGNTTF